MYNQEITERWYREQELSSLERLDLVGQIAEGIGHEVRNPLTTVRGFLQMYRRKPGSRRYRDYVDLMMAELDRANGIITEFMSLSKNKAVNRQPNDLNQIIAELLPTICSIVALESKYIQTEFGAIPHMLLDKKEISHIILNLVKNGLEAMQAGGTITIRTFVDDGKVVLAIQNEGPQIGEKILCKLGTPFFSTKQDAVGLGLAQCYSIAARHNAVIRVRTSSARTTFAVRFPGS